MASKVSHLTTLPRASMTDGDGGTSRVKSRIAWAARLALGAVVSAAVGLGLLGLGLHVAPSVGEAATPHTGPRRPPVVPPTVPLGAPESWALYSYVEKVNQAWNRDWPTVIVLLEEFLSRYPGNPTAVDALYAAYLEDGKLQAAGGDEGAARRRYEQAGGLNEDRGEAWLLLDELDKKR
jgi:hypothetical protein